MTRGQPRDIERRSTPLAVELRSSMGGRALGGYAAVFNSPSRDLGGFVEIVTRSAFSKSQADGWPGVLCRADHYDVVGSTRGNTLQLSLDSIGLDYTCDVAMTRAGDDLLTLARRNDLSGSSFAFACYEDDWGNDGEMLVRNLVSVRLIDCAPCAQPVAYEASTVSLRTLAVQVDAPLDDVLELAKAGELRKLLCRTDPVTPPKSGYAKSRQAQEVRARYRSWRQAQVELLGLSPGAHQQTQRRTRSAAQARAQLTRLLVPQPHQSAAQARKELTYLATPPYQTAASAGMNNVDGRL